jgi:tetratricopeptide (TPR) repeat protein
VEAERHFREAARLAPDSIQAHFFYGSELGRDGKPADAAREFREAVRIMPNMVEARFNLAISLADAGNYPEALEQFEKVLGQDPANTKALQYEQALRQKLAGEQSR